MLSPVLKYKAPVIKALPSLSRVGSEVLAPRYLSSKLSYKVAADAAEEAALVADVEALLALVEALLAEDDALEAEVAAN
jgi:hypothetical protein